MAKKATSVIDNFEVLWGDNEIKEPMPRLGNLFLNASNGDEVVSIDNGEGGSVDVRVGPIALKIRKPTTKEKKLGEDYMIEVVEGLDEKCVVLGLHAGASHDAGGSK